MRYYVIIPVYNEQDHIIKMLDSLLSQSLLAEKVVIVDDNSTDNSARIIKEYIARYDFIELVYNASEAIHLPGSKVIKAFNKGLEVLDDNYDFIVKLDGDLILPTNYFEQIAAVFQANPKVGMAGGRAYIEKNDQLILESLTDDDHIRGAFKSYRKACFLEIGKLKADMGWDTVDELLARYYGWEIAVDKSLQVKHLKPTGNQYNSASRYKQGEAFYSLGYGAVITVLASMKLAFKKGKPLLCIDYIKGYYKAKKAHKPLLVTAEQAKFIRNYRWKKIKAKLRLSKG
ncbi:MAG TPA: glycosyltransferase family A protein [Flavobacterium sp.]|nr:glycosyltransferase family A protein [Flavobacterium sp.]